MNKLSPNPRHSLSQVNHKKMIAVCAVCGSTDVRKRKDGKIKRYICATKKQNYAREYRLSRFPPHPRTYSPSAHVLSEVNDMNKTAVCSQCGLVKIYLSRHKNSISRRCSKANIANVTHAKEKRKR